ncbi:signal peptidase II [Chlamydia ibidis]|uniref:Lipoprotein signal peptidase n=2 Tax=Chlamydia ibidis TaxID=1405396 RepID=S7J4R9_9CHLA|nr:signal peptidase II [Chlamydia ibidis]EPP35409.1 signal peptidase II [Chlamydia ibidis]EQM63094.1 signal peptidase II [Chlamydia ibidis 10-1398/6]
MSNRTSLIPFCVVFFVLIDWITKFAVLLESKGNLSTPILYRYSIGELSFSLIPTFNEGAAFGLFSKYKYILFSLRIIVIVGLLTFLFFKKNALNSVASFSLTLLVSGAIGNVGDIIFHGHVIDFIALQYKNWAFPTFNFADIFISVGTILLISKLYFPTKQTLKRG